MIREYQEWHSPNLHRKMELLVFGHSGARVLVFPTRGGRFYDFENFGLVRVLTEQIESGHLQLYCVDSIDYESFYCFWAHPRGRLERHMRYENYIMEEVLPLSEHKNPNPYVMTHGCSLGAYHAVNLAFRYPHIFYKTVAFSGRYDLTMSISSFPDLLGGYYDDDVYFHTPSHYMPNLNDEHTIGLLRRMEIVFTVGEHDAFLDNNLKLSDTLWNKGIPHSLHIWSDEAHNARYWRRMLPHYI